MSNKVEKIVIVGGGSAGWMTAATLAERTNKHITVIESPDVPIVGVGESTIGGIRNWMNLLNITEQDFFKETDASYKLSIKFTDFFRKGSGSFHYPFGSINTDGNTFNFNDWYFKKYLHPDTDVSDYASCMYSNMALVDQNKVDDNVNLPGFDFKRDTAFHFDATKFGAWLRDHYCLPRGVVLVSANVTDIQSDEDGIKHLDLDNDMRVTGDLYIDCTGFKSMLLGGELKEPFVSFDEWLPNNSAWATRVPYTNKEEQLECWTECTAIENGWVWNIPLWSRIGTGYVYSDKYVSNENALEEFKRHLVERHGEETCKDLEFKNIKMRTGYHERLWVKNVVAIGLSGGFIEPLESSGLYTVHEFLVKLLRSINRSDYVNEWDRKSFNDSCLNKFIDFCQFVALHYAMSHRDDTPYWKDAGKRIYNDAPHQAFTRSIVERYDYRQCSDPFTGFHSIFAGFNYHPEDKDSIDTYFYKGEKDFNKLVNNLEIKKILWREECKFSPSTMQAVKAIRDV